MRMYDIIKKKRDGAELSDDEIKAFVTGCVTGEIPDYQLSALMMAVYFKGLSERETLTLTLAMRDSGDTVDLSGISGIKADKHSTGGVGDKTSLCVAPIVACCGVKIAKMSGRGLGHTGGTIDKLEAIPGFSTSLTKERFFEIVNSVGVAIAGQTGNLCPADKKLYALRDVTATVENMSLIASSIMSKKLASGADVIVLDVKCGSGAFMHSRADAEELAREMVRIGKGAGKAVRALITDMDSPLGHAVGNSLEVAEAAELLLGDGPDDLREVVMALSANMLELSGYGDADSCLRAAEDAVKSGKAAEKLCAMVEAQGGDPRYTTNPSLFGRAEYEKVITAERDGYLTAVNAAAIGEAAGLLGAGRARKEDSIDPLAGIIVYKKKGDSVERGDILARLYTSDESLIPEAERRYISALSITDIKPAPEPMIFGVI